MADKKWVGGGALLIAAGIFTAIQVDFTPIVEDPADFRECLIVADEGDKAGILSPGQIIRAEALGYVWGTCENPQTQADIDHCHAQPPHVVFTVRTVRMTEAERSLVNEWGGIPILKVDAVEAPVFIFTMSLTVTWILTATPSETPGTPEASPAFTRTVTASPTPAETIQSSVTPTVTTATTSTIPTESPSPTPAITPSPTPIGTPA